MERMINMGKAKDILDRISDSRTFREAAITLDEVKDALVEAVSINDADNSAEIKKMQAKIDRLSESNKQLMAENKKLKAAK